MSNDLFVMLNNNKFAPVLQTVEKQVEKLTSNRHDYPIWPRHNDPLDAFEKEYHGQIRSVYYRNTIHMIQVLRALRSIG